MKIEYDILDHCNLNCKNCGHFSQYKAKNERSVEVIRADITKLHSKIPITIFRIVGGEPLIHTRICEVLLMLRKILGDNAEITLVTNGIKILKMNEYFFTLVKVANISIEISKYPIKISYNDVEKTLTNKNIKFKSFEITNFYNFIDSTGSQDALESFSLCRSKFYCPFYDGENIYLCAYVSNVPFANAKFNYKLENNFVSVNDTTENIQQYLQQPCTTCRFCRSTRQPEKWEIEHDR
jgi:organic radical activating enzyme